MCLAEVKVYIILDSYASSKLFIICDQSCLKSFVYSGRLIQTTQWSTDSVKGLENTNIGKIYMLQYHALKQKESESGAEYVDREMREYLALPDVGINIDASIG